MQSFNIIIDSREKKPLPFPATIEILSPNAPHILKGNTVRLNIAKPRQLKTSDYLLENEEGNIYTNENGISTVAIERKASAKEVEDNLFTRKGRKYFMACLDRLAADFTHPLIILEGGQDMMLRDRKGGIILDGLIRETMQRNISVVYTPSATTLLQRKRIGELVARYLIQGITLDG